MSSKLITPFFLIAALLIIADCAQADAFPPMPTAPAMEAIPPSSPLNPSTVSPTESNAIGFATQAGAIAGIATACSQDITLFSNRVAEAVNKLSTNAADRVLAMENFQSAMRRAQTIQASKNTIPCAEVIKEFNNLPLLRDDYRNSVISQLSPTMGAANNPPLPPNKPTNPSPSQVQTNSGYPPIPVPGTTPPNTSPSAIQQNAGYPPGGTTSPSSIPPSGMNQPSPTTQQYVDNKTPPALPNSNIYNSK